MDRYFVIEVSEDGDVSLRQFSRAELEAAVDGEDIDLENAERDVENAGDLGGDSPGRLWVIRGALVRPIARQAITKWEF